MRYGKDKLNILQEERVVGAFFDEAFAQAIQEELDAFITKQMEDSDNDFLMFSDGDIDMAIKEHTKVIRMLSALKHRSENAKFKDTFYYSQP